ncbi:MAG: aldose 1-epimerase [Chloroflexi bacterium]|nr:aldose 1-epimerase [Chloroflexota bacterium]
MSRHAIPVTLEAGDVRLTIAPHEGGRLASLAIAGDEILVTGSPAGPMYWGCYPMAPWAGRIRHGRFRFRGQEVQLPLGSPPHAIHGITYDRPWAVVDDRTLATRLGASWPFRGELVQQVTLLPGGLEVSLELRALDAMPAVIGWHPWFRRSIAGVPVEISLEARAMLRRDAEGLPAGELVAPTPGPWDDAFTGVERAPRLTWPGRVRLEMESTCRWWVAYTERPDAVCIEPQSGPPDAVNLAGRSSHGLDLGPAMLEPGETLRHTMTWRWASLRGTASPARA